MSGTATALAPYTLVLHTFDRRATPLVGSVVGPAKHPEQTLVLWDQAASPVAEWTDELAAVPA